MLRAIVCGLVLLAPFPAAAAGDKKGDAKNEDKLIDSTVQKGRFGMRRVKKELIFLAADDPLAEMKEIGKMPFPDSTIRAVRFTADPGGSPTAIDARVRQIRATGQELTGAIPKRERKSMWYWWLLLIPAAIAGFFIWRYRDVNLWGGDDD